MTRVTRSNQVMSGAWVVAHTRIPTAAIRRFYDAGYSTSAILKEYPGLTPADIRAALEHERRIAEDWSV